MVETKATYKVEEMTNQELVKTTRGRLDFMQMMLMSGRIDEANDLLNQAYNCLEQLEINTK